MLYLTSRYRAFHQLNSLMDWIATLMSIVYPGLLAFGWSIFYNELYAAAGGRKEGAVPVFFADGQECDISQYDGFSALKLEAFDLRVFRHRFNGWLRGCALGC